MEESAIHQFTNIIMTRIIFVTRTPALGCMEEKMKKLIIIMGILAIASIKIFATTPKKYVEEKYGNKAILFTEDVDDWLDQESVNERSPIVFYNSTSKDIEFELHELKTKFNNVNKDVIKKIKGREIVKIKAGEYFIPSITFEDIEHIVFLFKQENKYEILAYSDNSLSEQYSKGYISGNRQMGFVVGSSESRTVYSIVFEIIEK